MSAKTATVKCYVAFVSLLTAVFSLASALVRLLVACVTALAALVKRSKAGTAHPAASPAVCIPVPVAVPMLASPMVQAPDMGPQVEHGLVSLGYKRPDVARFVASLSNRRFGGDVGALIKEGLAALSS
jgi:hypothetical protein